MAKRKGLIERAMFVIDLAVNELCGGDGVVVVSASDLKLSQRALKSAKRDKARLLALEKDNVFLCAKLTDAARGKGVPFCCACGDIEGRCDCQLPMKREKESRK